ncbi:hypothetical protein MTR62_09190 [Novosphingobium sp. 1949]|uniref:Uncharacterized protein n=1 Tax=Novosphingobium organovorum TaxID=2930092 RepID=A0ABT0BD89_9SPHN|nr:hypothetical protein [Novosphingobium organovorum]MCJ2182865.1 hypothetical protein [Novosphingobium organovorum]
MVGAKRIVKRRLRFVVARAISGAMEGPENARPAKETGQKNLTREERLAAKLRENLRRRKAQARAFDAAESPQASGESGRESHIVPPVSARPEPDRLSKSSPES